MPLLTAAGMLLFPLPLTGEQPVAPGWDFVPIKDATGAWWRTLRIDSTIPGVGYELVASPDLADWSVAATRYGNGRPWRCPIVREDKAPGPNNGPPAAVLNPESASLPTVSLTLERNNAGHLVASWISLDDPSLARRHSFSGVSPDPALAGKSESSFQFHANRFFGLSPRMTHPVAFTGTVTNAGPLDAALISSIASHFPAMQDQLLAAAQSPDPDASTPDPASVARFYQVRANFDLDSDGDSIADHRELGHYGTNAFAADSDGDGLADAWEISHGLDAVSAQDGGSDPDGDGLSNAQEQELGLNPKLSDNPGIAQEQLINGDFSVRSIGSGIRSQALPTPLTWDYWADWATTRATTGWMAVKGTHVELQVLEPKAAGNQYCELEAHPAGNAGIKQQVGTRPGVTYLVVFDCKPRHDGTTTAADSNFEVHADGTRIAEVNFTSKTGWETRSASFRATRTISEISFISTGPSSDNARGALLDDVRLVPVEVVELSPKVKDEEGNKIDGSEKPNQGEPLTPFVEEDPHANRIAHREMKVRIGEALKGKEITWTLEPLFIPHFDPNGPNLPPVFRGEWEDSPVAAHGNAFEVSSVYGANGFEIDAGQGEDTVAKTTVADDGFTAIRVNVPPIGFNQARIRIQIEGTDAPIDLIDMEVPAVIVIDPGHGIGPHFNDSNVVGGEADDSGELEHAFALNLAQRTRTEIRDHEEAQRRNIRVFLTRENPTNISAVARTKVARDNGCDVYMSIHFNDSTSRQHRDPFGMWDSTGNLNLEEDQALAIRLRQAVQAAITEVEPAESRNAYRSDYDSEHWESVLQKGLDTCSDLQGGSPYNGNIPGYTPCRAALIEIEWMSHSAADALFNTNQMAEQMRAATAKRLAGACIQDVMVQPEAN